MLLSEKLIRLPMGGYEIPLIPAIDLDNITIEEDHETYFTIRPKHQAFSGKNAFVRVELYEGFTTSDLEHHIREYMRHLFGKELAIAHCDNSNETENLYETYLFVYMSGDAYKYVLIKGEQAPDFAFMARVEVDAPATAFVRHGDDDDDDLDNEDGCNFSVSDDIHLPWTLFLREITTLR